MFKVQHDSAYDYQKPRHETILTFDDIFGPCQNTECPLNIPEMPLMVRYIIVVQLSPFCEILALAQLITNTRSIVCFFNTHTVFQISEVLFRKPKFGQCVLVKFLKRRFTKINIH